jgi:hypothetical protein
MKFRVRTKLGCSCADHRLELLLQVYGRAARFRCTADSRRWRCGASNC